MSIFKKGEADETRRLSLVRGLSSRNERLNRLAVEIRRRRRPLFGLHRDAARFQRNETKREIKKKKKKKKKERRIARAILVNTLVTRGRRSVLFFSGEPRSRRQDKASDATSVSDSARAKRDQLLTIMRKFFSFGAPPRWGKKLASRKNVRNSMQRRARPSLFVFPVRATRVSDERQPAMSLRFYQAKCSGIKYSPRGTRLRFWSGFRASRWLRVYFEANNVAVEE